MKMPKKTPPTHALITNTTGKHPGPTVPGLPIGETVGAHAVLAQEAQGTREVAAANGTRRPIDGTTDDKAQLNCQRVGIKLGEPVAGDPLFRHAELPAGWKTAPSTEDSRTTDLLDAKGNRRGAIWYKAASYDRRASMYLFRRYHVEQDWPDTDFKTGEGDSTRRLFIVKDRATGKAVWRGEIFARPTGSDAAEWQAYEKTELAMRQAALAWLSEHFPDHDNVGAYWDAP